MALSGHLHVCISKARTWPHRVGRQAAYSHFRRFHFAAHLDHVLSCPPCPIHDYTLYTPGALGRADDAGLSWYVWLGRLDGW
jgi:hypothetical protein